MNILEEEKGDVDNTRRVLQDKYSATELDDLHSAFEELIKEGLLFSHDPSVENYQPPEDLVVKALCLHAAHDCNLRCRYCFAGTGDFGGDRGIMDLETGKKAIDFLLQASGSRRHVEIDYFGGEPLLNFSVVRELIEYGQEKRCV